MSLNQTQSSIRKHIAFFGCTNVGKSSLVNAITNQDLSLVSNIKGTTTDPVKKAMEILPLGPVVIIDTAGLDDNTELGQMRIEKSKNILNQTDIAILVLDSNIGKTVYDTELIKDFESKKIPYLVVYNKLDLVEIKENLQENEIYVSSKTKENVEELKNKIGNILNNLKEEKYIISDKVNKNDVVVLVIPVDESAPKGRIILPQQNTLRELLDKNCSVICCQDTELEQTLNILNKPPKIVITDSQVFGKIKDLVPKNILLTSFSILLARYKGLLTELVKGAATISKLENNDLILISEGCTHHRQCNDIGTVKFPNWLKEFTKKELNFEFSSGNDFPQNLSKYKLIIHCGGCMLNEKEMHNRIKFAKENKVKIVNYGIAIAYMNGILKRSLEIFPEILDIIKE